MKSLIQLCIMVVGLMFCLSAAAAKYPLKVSSLNPRILVDQTNAPFLLVGDAPHSLLVNISQSDAAFYLANRRTNGFNSLWVELMCVKYTGGRENGSLLNGTLPFTAILKNSSGNGLTTLEGDVEYDLSTPNANYFAYVDEIIRMAATNGIQIMLDPLDTGGLTQMALDNGTNRCRAFGQYLGNRYKNFPNLIWLSGNDFQNWRTAANDAVITAIALGIKDKDTNHLQTVELDYYVSSSLDDPNWAPIVGLNLAYTYYPTYAEMLHAYQQTTNMPVFMGEAYYEFANQGGPPVGFGEQGMPGLLRREEYWAMLSGAAGQVYGNDYTWPFRNGWQSHLNSTGVAQLKYVTTFFASHSWDNLVPDINHTVLTSGYGAYATNGLVGANDYATAASTGDGTLALAYLPTMRTVMVNLWALRGVATAQWFDPTSGTYLPINGSPFYNTGTQDFTPPGNNSAADPDWVLVLSADVTKPTLMITAPTTGQRWSNSTFNVTGIAADNVQVSNVQYQLNGLGWNLATTANQWSNWTAQVNLLPGTNIIQARDMDTSGTFSTTNQVSFYYVPVAMLTVQTNGHGTISPNYNGAILLIGSNYVMTATAATGFSFAGWTGSSMTNGTTLRFVMASNLNFSANFKDVTKPALMITTPTGGQRWSNAVFTAKGTASDNVQVSNVFYSLNGGNWINATGTTNWSAIMNLVPGTNHLAAYAADFTGNNSTTNSVNLDFVATNKLVLGENGLGTFSPNYSNAWLELGRNYSMTAAPGSGFIFSNWISNMGWVSNAAVLNFMMQSNLTLTARFMDVAKPVLTITSPTIGQRWSNAMFVVQGKASDNFAVSSVTFLLDNDVWINAAGTTNWSATVNLVPGTNHLSAYATDITGNNSATNSLNFDFVVTNQLILGENEIGTISPNYSNVWLELGRNYSMTATPASGFVFSNWTSNVGWVSNTAALNFMMQSNLMLTARFVDVAKPVLTITSPTTGQRMTNALANVKGIASDNWKVTGVWYQANGKAWSPATSTNVWTNWTATVPLVAGTNKLLAYAVDLAGNTSTTNSISLVSSNTFKFELSPISSQLMTGNGWGFSLQVSPGLNGTIQASTDLVNWVKLGNFVGTNSAVNINDLTASNYNLRFYRAVVQ